MKTSESILFVFATYSHYVLLQTIRSIESDPLHKNIAPEKDYRGG